MDFTILNKEGLKAELTFKGMVEATSAQLKTVFGEPTHESAIQGLVTTQWVIRWEDDSISAIYDWDEQEHGVPADDKVLSWHVGGTAEETYTNVIDKIRENL